MDAGGGLGLGLVGDGLGFDVEGVGAIGQGERWGWEGEGLTGYAGGFFLVGLCLGDVEDAAEDEEFVVVGVGIRGGVIGAFGLLAAGDPDGEGALAFLDTAAEFLPLLEAAHDGNG